MLLVEAASKELYVALSQTVSDPIVQDLLLSNGREELAHAHRVSRAIGILTGSDYPVPEPEENPYLAAEIPQREVTADMLTALAQSEFGGKNLYENWAQNSQDFAVSDLSLLNGREEVTHGNRLRRAVPLMTRC